MVVADNSPGRPRPAPHTLRLATIGAGRIGSNHAAIVARQIPGVTLAAVSDPVPGAAERLATELGAPPATTDVHEVLDREDIDGVLITAPARAHTDPHGARRALSIALAAIRSVETDRPVTIAEVTA
ncbi:Gfo/Idh/MocA family oxidoreductase [Streptomyces sp. NPDC101234]|uniref:Gfo/Idh/MocA family oxidoreductase n=1 Tax=Streptomyces sp. NPDC101234 TaxID=3366138 RepID=UPI003806642D